jgi:hypothetical protein
MTGLNQPSRNAGRGKKRSQLFRCRIFEIDLRGFLFATCDAKEFLKPPSVKFLRLRVRGDSMKPGKDRRANQTDGDLRSRLISLPRYFFAPNSVESFN